MKLILTREVAGLGLAGDIVEVADGYGRNFLVPRGAAITWTKGAEKQIAQIKRARDAREIRDLGHAREIKAELEALTVALDARAGKDGRLFGSITSADIAAAVSPPAARCWTASGSSCPGTSRRPARTRSPSSCTRTSSRRVPDHRQGRLSPSPGANRPCAGVSAAAPCGESRHHGIARRSPEIHRPTFFGPQPWTRRGRCLLRRADASQARHPQAYPPPVYSRAGDSHRAVHSCVHRLGLPGRRAAL